MKQTNITLPIFPLPIFLLPGGVTKLRIFEPRYLKMVSIASSGQGFVIWLKDKKVKDNAIVDQILWGSWVDIINFDQGEDGVLEVDVKCKSLIEINSIEQDSDNLHFGEVSIIKHWSETSIDNAGAELSKSLETVFSENKRLNDLYTKKSLNNTPWVLARWLEILPLDLGVKNKFVVNNNFKEAKAFVESVIFDSSL
ncbi:LON peptidase substrate-binding domain-containing protein [Colwellia sp. 12G3]|uniref:LON peptidase substrate-binding domain-containing protein n=1 Tax=Colwellia sp. 12G3 TaxID=2058299 RepID=UPI000C330D22|nr:LON peptidase substrate-binding domain-containing protein [Colwellia sp. 12G3]PKI14850.1 ATP-dependent protease [Colwellia sp. 12G3]